MGPLFECACLSIGIYISIYLFTYLSMASWLIAHPNGGADGERKRSVTQGGARGARILRAVASPTSTRIPRPQSRPKAA